MLADVPVRNSVSSGYKEEYIKVQYSASRYVYISFSTSLHAGAKDIDIINSTDKYIIVAAMNLESNIRFFVCEFTVVHAFRNIRRH